MFQSATVFISAVAAVGSLVALLVFVKPYGYLPETVEQVRQSVEEVKQANAKQDAAISAISSEESAIKTAAARAAQLSEDTNEKATHIQTVLDSLIWSKRP